VSAKTNPTTPEAFPIPPPQLYAVDLGSIQRDLGRLTEAVDTLKGQLKDHDARLGKVYQDVHDIKSAGKALRWVIGIVSGIVSAIAAIILTEYFHHLFNAK
jgi:hypothetical protein